MNCDIRGRNIGSKDTNLSRARVPPPNWRVRMEIALAVMCWRPSYNDSIEDPCVRVLKFCTLVQNHIKTTAWIL
jgi:hypothetical protein